MQFSDRLKTTVGLVSAKMMLARSEGKYYETEPGNTLLADYPDILKELSQGIKSIVVTGTNGKTTTCRMISSIFNEAGISHFANPEGANMENRITTVFCENFLEGDNRKDTAVLECDENYIRTVLPKINATCLVITNIYIDQLSRFGSEKHVAEVLCEGLRKSSPAVCFLPKDCHYREIITAVPGWRFLYYDEDIGRGKLPKLRIPGIFNIKNALAARSVAGYWGIKDDVINEGLKKAGTAFGRFETIRTEAGYVTICLAKNPEGFRVINEWLLQEEHEPYTRLLLAMNHNGGDDLNTGWLRQIDYTGITSSFNPVFITGNCVETLSEEICLTGGRYETMPIEDVAKTLAKKEGRTLIIANYSAMMMIRNGFVSIGCAEEYWKK
jgi:UDP-N-acetylmuramyl tripeptide synthase